MRSPEFAVHYVDGTSETVARRPVHMMRAEAVASSDAGPNEVILASLWAAATGGKGSRDDFEAWAETVDDWERAKTSAGDADPLDQEQSDSPD